jgi:hypothetical protein
VIGTEGGVFKSLTREDIEVLFSMSDPDPLDDEEEQ